MAVSGNPPFRKVVGGKKILVTGGTGSFGSALVRELLKHDPAIVRIYSRDESKQHELQAELGPHVAVRFLIGDVRDRDRLTRACEDIDLVYHAAAMKHVGACEYNPFEALKTNILGVQNLIDATRSSGVEAVVNLSTDKAANPSNTMGVSKLFAERLITAANFAKGPHPIRYVNVRFGNVLGSRGSVIPTIRRQVEAGGPVTLTDRDMTRYVMSIRECLAFVIKVVSLARGGELFVLKMPVVRVEDLVTVLVDEFARTFGRDPRKIEIREVGPHPGEKAAEELYTREEGFRLRDLGDMYVVDPENLETYLNPASRKPRPAVPSARPGRPPAPRTGFRHAAPSSASTEVPPLSREQIRDLLRRENLI